MKFASYFARSGWLSLGFPFVVLTTLAFCGVRVDMGHNDPNTGGAGGALETSTASSAGGIEGAGGGIAGAGGGIQGAGGGIAGAGGGIEGAGGGIEGAGGTPIGGAGGGIGGAGGASGTPMGGRCTNSIECQDGLVCGCANDGCDNCTEMNGTCGLDCGG